MVEQAVAYFFRMASEDTYSSAKSTTNIQVHKTSKYIKLMVCLWEWGVGACTCTSMIGEH